MSPLHPYDLAALAELGPDRVAQHATAHPALTSRPTVVVRYSTDSHGRGQWVATLKRSPNERAARLAGTWADGPDAAAAALLNRQGLTWAALPVPASLDGGTTYGYVMAHPGEGQALAAGARAVWALAAAAELESATAGGEPPDLALMMARVATGTDRPRPVVAGWRYAGRLDGVTLTDVVGEPIAGLTFGDHLSPAGVLAAAQAAGWLLTAPMRATAHRLADVIGTDPDPAAVAQALAARGGCPAVVATLKGQAVAQ